MIFTALVTGLELVAVDDIELEQQLVHGSTAQLVEQSHTGKHALHSLLHAFAFPGYAHLNSCHSHSTCLKCSNAY